MDRQDKNENLVQDEEKVLINLVKDVCSQNEISQTLKNKVNKILADADLDNHLSLHKINAIDETSSNLLGLVKATSTELTYEEQTELNEAVIRLIDNKLSEHLTSLDTLTNSELGRLVAENSNVQQRLLKKENIKNQLLEELDAKLAAVKGQEKEKLDIMMDWLNFRLKDVSTYNENCVEWMSVKNKMLELKAKIINLQILQQMFTETNESLKAYVEIEKDLKERIEETERRINEYKELIHSDDI